jgi:hypothetical protein
MEHIEHHIAKTKIQESLREARHAQLSRQAKKGKQHRMVDARWFTLQGRMCGIRSPHGNPGNQVRQPDDAPQNLEVPKQERQEQAFKALNNAVSLAVVFFSESDENHFDGYQTAHEVLANLVFWHREHVRIARSLVEGTEPRLMEGAATTFNTKACQNFKNKAIPVMAQQLDELQVELAGLLRCLPDWEMDFPLKNGGRYCTVEDRVNALASSVRHHTALLRRAAIIHSVATPSKPDTHSR